MEEDRHLRAKRAVEVDAAADDAGWKPGVGQLLGLVLALLLIGAAILLGVTTGAGFIIILPVILVALIIAFITVRGSARARQVAGACPHCGARIRTPAHIAELDCESCGKRVELRGKEFVRAG